KDLLVLLLQLADRNSILPEGLLHYIIFLYSPAEPGVAFSLKLTTTRRACFREGSRHALLFTSTGS
ncbi:MAG TPA: hypothetical protein H9724_05545, partial [Candidatus Gemmiger avistercoris]|nr:hypothetical protein [Candidatus Gemmiger avistercoris]